MVMAEFVLNVCEQSVDRGVMEARQYFGAKRGEMFVRALHRLNSVTPLKYWRQDDLDRLTCDGYLRRSDRFKLCVHLLGNGCAEKDIMVLMRHMLRDDSAIRDVVSLLKLNEPRKKSLWYYDTSMAVHKYLDGRLKRSGRSGQGGSQEQLFLWEDFAFNHRSWVTLEMSNKFFDQRDIQCPYVFFGIKKE